MTILETDANQSPYSSHWIPAALTLDHKSIIWNAEVPGNDSRSLLAGELPDLGGLQIDHHSGFGQKPVAATAASFKRNDCADQHINKLAFCWKFRICPPFENTTIFAVDEGDRGKTTGYIKRL